MSHGSGGGDDKVVEPNLVPMLDLVLQLVMFFMAVTNFAMEQANVKVVLPEATTAVSLDSSVEDVIYINVDKTGAILPTDGDRQPLLTPQQIEVYLKRRFENKVEAETDKVAGKAKAKKTIVIVRAHQETRMSSVMTVMKSCKMAGFEKVQLRAKKA